MLLWNPLTVTGYTQKRTPDYVGELVKILRETFAKGGNVVIPSFAVGRTQEMLYFLRKIKTEGMVERLSGFPVYVRQSAGGRSNRNLPEKYI